MGKDAKYVVRLTAAEREQLQELVDRGRGAKSVRQRARVLLKADQAEGVLGWTDERVAEFAEVSLSTVHRLQPSSRGTLSLDTAFAGRQTGGVAGGRKHQPRVRASHAEKNELQPHRKEQWVIPPEQNAEFVAAMEDVLEVYQRPHDPQRPLVCLDEQSKQLIKETRRPVAAAPGRVERRDYEYERNGTANLFMLFAPLEGWRHVKVTERRTKVDFAAVIRDLVDVHFPAAEKIVLVLDNLNTHKLSSRYEAFSPAEARRLIEKLEIHDTPKHGSWLDMAETELSILTKQCLNRRIPDADTLIRQVAAWESARNAAHARIDWRFTTAQARIKLKRLYPSIQL